LTFELSNPRVLLEMQRLIMLLKGIFRSRIMIMIVFPCRFAPVTALLISLLAFSPSTSTASPAGWGKDLRAAMAESQRTGKPILADFSASWCPGCRQMEQQTFPDPGIQGRLEQFIPVYVDSDENPDLISSYKVSGLPTIMTLSPEGKIITRNTGFMSSNALANKLDGVLAKYVPPPTITREPERAVASAQTPAPEVKAPATKPPSINSAQPPPPTFAEVEARRRSAEREEVIASVKRTQKDLGANNSDANFYVASASGERFPTANQTPSPKIISQQNKPRFEGVSQENPAAALATTAREQKSLIVVAQAPSQDSLPKPLLNAGSTRETEKEASAKPTGGDPLSTIRMLENAPKVAIAPPPATTDLTPKPEAEKSPSTTTEKPAETDSKKPSEEDINRWMKDGTAKLRDGRKREARAMYEQVYEADPKNVYGQSDLAFLRATSLIVDKDDDALRRKAYDRIKEFPTKFPDSKHKDNYTIIRATLAIDLGEKEEAAKLLFDFPDRFKDSRYADTAYTLWNSVKDAKSSTKSDSEKKSSSR